MDNILPIVIGLIWVGYKIYRKNLETTQKASNPQTNNAASEVSFIDNAFQEFKNQFSEPTTQNDYFSNATIATEKKTKVVQDNFASIEYEKVPSNFEKKAQSQDIKPDKKNINTNSFEFDFRKAIIYHAIIDRPYN